MNNIPQTFSDHFNKIYKQTKYLDKYGGSVVTTTLTILFFFFLFSYYYIQRKIEPIKQDWANQRCSPPVMAFAGIINKPPEITLFDISSNVVDPTADVEEVVIKVNASDLEDDILWYDGNERTAKYTDSVLTSLHIVNNSYCQIEDPVPAAPG